MNITVTHTLAPEIISLFQGLFTAGNPQKPVQEFTGYANVATQKSEPVIAAPAHPTDETTDQGAQGKVSIEQLRLAVQEKSEKKAEVKALLAEFGAQNLSALLPNNRESFLAKVKAL